MALFRILFLMELQMYKKETKETKKVSIVFCTIALVLKEEKIIFTKN